MKLSKYTLYFIKDFLITLVILLAGVGVLMALLTKSAMTSSLVLQLTLGALGFNFIRYGLVQKYAVGKSQQLISYFFNTTMAVIVFFLWIYFFSVNKSFSTGVTITFIVSFIIAKIAVYYMMKKDAQDQVDEINQKFSDRKKAH